MTYTTMIQGLTVLEIENFLTHQEVDSILDSRKNNFEKAISHYPKYYRNNDRLVEDNISLSTYLFDKLNSLPSISTEITDTIIGVNERIRFCRYQKGQEFSTHQDGIYYPDDAFQSKFTFLLYLNDHEDFIGGETHFYTSKTDNTPIKTSIPKKGKLIIFDHSLWHKGTKVLTGNKYILRSDIIIKKREKTKHHQGYIWNLSKVTKDTFLSCGRDTKIKLWNTNLELLKSINVHTKSVLKTIPLSNSMFISCSRDFTIKKWSLTGDIISSIYIGEMILNMTIHNETDQIIAAGTTGKIYILDYNLKVVKTIQIHQAWVWDLTIIETNKLISCSEDGTVYRTDLDLGTSECIYTHKEAIFCIHTESDNSIFMGSKSGHLIRICIHAKKLTDTKMHTDIIRSIIRYKNYIITCGEDNTVKIMDLRSQEIKEIYSSTNFIQDIICLEQVIYIAGYDGLITKIRM